MKFTLLQLRNTQIPCDETCEMTDELRWVIVIYNTLSCCYLHSTDLINHMWDTYFLSFPELKKPAVSGCYLFFFFNTQWYWQKWDCLAECIRGFV